MTTHVFIVGLPRTGSTLTRGILNASPSIWVAGESHYLSRRTRLGLVRRPGWSERFERIGDLRTDEGLDRVVQAIFAMHGKSFWARLGEKTDAAHFGEMLRSTERSHSDLLDVALRVFANGRPIRGEKTPHHIHHVPTLLEWYPDARIIHTMRDPRAVYASLRHKERAERLSAVGRAARRLGRLFDFYSTANVSRQWLEVVELHRAYESRYPDRYTMIRFEDLVQQPREAAAALSAFLGVPYEPAMLGQVVHNSSFLERGAPSGIDTSVVERWRDHLPARLGSRLARLCADGMEELGYRV